MPPPSLPLNEVVDADDGENKHDKAAVSGGFDDGSGRATQAYGKGNFAARNSAAAGAMGGLAGMVRRHEALSADVLNWGGSDGGGDADVEGNNDNDADDADDAERQRQRQQRTTSTGGERMQRRPRQADAAADEEYDDRHEGLVFASADAASSSGMADGVAAGDGTALPAGAEQTVPLSPSASLRSPRRAAPQARFRWRHVCDKLGPAFLISIGYMDPGNWATDIEGGSRFGYDLLWVLVVSNAVALLLQVLASRLGIVTQRHLAQLCREEYPRSICTALFVLAQLAIVATDLAEVLGTAIGLNLLFGMPLVLGVMITVLDTFLLLVAQRHGMRRLEQVMFVLLGVISCCFLVELAVSKPSAARIVAGLVPRINSKSLFVAMGMLGATVMPHNFYLHSAIVTKRVADRRTETLRVECKYSAVDCAVALNSALFINAAILITSAANFWTRGITVTTLQDAHELLERVLDVRVFGGVELAPLAFGVALIAAGQSSTLTGTLAGQYVMEGFMDFHVRPWLQRLITRLCAVVPSCVIILILGDESTYKMLIVSQVVLSLQLPFAIVPMIRFTGSKRLMGEQFADGFWVSIAAWASASFVIALNVWLVLDMLVQAIRSGHGAEFWLSVLLLLPCLVLVLALLVWLVVRRERDGEAVAVRSSSGGGGGGGGRKRGAQELGAAYSAVPQREQGVFIIGHEDDDDADAADNDDDNGDDIVAGFARAKRDEEAEGATTWRLDDAPSRRREQRRWRRDDESGLGNSSEDNDDTSYLLDSLGNSPRSSLDSVAAVAAAAAEEEDDDDDDDSGGVDDERARYRGINEADEERPVPPRW